MAELGHNYNIQCMKLFQELKAVFPTIPDDAVRQCMKKNHNEKDKCTTELVLETHNYLSKGGIRYKPRGKYSASARRRSMDALCMYGSGENSTVHHPHGYYGANKFPPGVYQKQRTNSFSEASRSTKILGGSNLDTPHRRPCYSPINNLNCDINISKRGSDEYLSGPPCKITKNRDDSEEGGEGVCNTEQYSDKIIEKNGKDARVLEAEPSSLCTKKKRAKPQPLFLVGEQTTSEDKPSSIYPTVVLTPDSPPSDNEESGEVRKVQTLYRPDDQSVAETHVIKSHNNFFPNGRSLESEISSAINKTHDNSISDEHSFVICGQNKTVTNTYTDILPGLGPITLPFGNSSIQESEKKVMDEGKDFELYNLSSTITSTSTTVSQGTVHVLKDIGNGNISFATTTFCGYQKSVFSPSTSSSPDAVRSKSTTVLYTVNRKPIICENPFRKVFAKRKEFYQQREKRESRKEMSPETSSKRLLWRHRCHNSNCSPENQENVPPDPPKFFTLNANIEPFEPFVIKHDLSSMNDSLLTPSSSSNSLGKMNVTLCPKKIDGQEGEEVELLPDGSEVTYLSKVKIPEDGSEACLEVKIHGEGSTITTKRSKGGEKEDCNQILVQLKEGGSRVDIHQSTISSKPPGSSSKPIRPSTLTLPDTKYATARPSPTSLRPPVMTPQLISPRYNSLPNLKGIQCERSNNGGGWGFQTHPKDEEKRLSYTRALLSHQMESLFKLDKELRQEKLEVEGVRSDVGVLENRMKRQALKNKPGQPSKELHLEVKYLDCEVTSLREDCDELAVRVSENTGGKVALGDTSINYADCLPTSLTNVPDHEQELSGLDPACRLEQDHLQPIRKSRIKRWNWRTPSP